MMVQSELSSKPYDFKLYTVSDSEVTVTAQVPSPTANLAPARWSSSWQMPQGRLRRAEPGRPAARWAKKLIMMATHASAAAAAGNPMIMASCDVLNRDTVARHWQKKSTATLRPDSEGCQARA